MMTTTNCCSDDYASAFRSVRTAKNFFMLVVLVMLLWQLAAFILVNFVGVLDYSKGQNPAMMSYQVKPVTTGQPTEAEENAALSDNNDASAAEFWYQFLSWSLPASKFIAVVLTALLVLTLAMALVLTLNGRLCGGAGIISAFFWSLIVLAMILPWQQIIAASFACGATYNLGELVFHASRVKSNWGATDVSFLDNLLYYARYIAYPVLVILVLLAVQAKFGRGYRAMTIYPVKPEAAEEPAEEPTMPQAENE